MEIDKLEYMSNYKSTQYATYLEFHFLQLLFRILDLSINTLPTLLVRERWGQKCITDVHLASDEIQPCLYIRTGFSGVLRYEDGSNELKYRVL